MQGTFAPALEQEHWLDLLATLEHCTKSVPLYAGIAPPDRSVDARDAALRALAAFPVLTKDRLRGAFPHKLVPSGVALGEATRSGEVSFVGTSGTTGERVQVLWHQPWWDAQELDGFDAHPLAGAAVRDPAYREAVLTTPVCSGNFCHVGRVPMDDRIVAGRTLFLNQTVDPSLWKDSDIVRMADELELFQPHAIEADPAYLAWFAVRLERLGRKPWTPRFVDVSYEFPSRRHVAQIERVFRAPVLDAYGSTECGFVFFECPSGRYHHNARWTHVEVQPSATPGLEGVGSLLITSMRNRWLNLVRFETGDLARVHAGPCDCGREGELVLESLEGRAKDLLFRVDGRAVTTRAVDRALAEVAGLLHYRVVQKTALEVDLELVADQHQPLDVDAASSALATLLGTLPRTRVVSTVPVEASGKFRLTRALHVDAEKLSKAQTA